MSSPQETPPAINRPSLPTPGPVKKQKAKSALELELQQVCDDLTDRLRLSDEDRVEAENEWKAKETYFIDRIRHQEQVNAE